MTKTSILSTLILLLACNGLESSQFTPQTVALREVRDTGLKELLDDKLQFVDEAGKPWIAPKGTRTDGASIPRLLLTFVGDRFAEKYLKAAIVHDAYCQSDNAHLEQYRSETWQAVHRMFLEAMIAGGTDRTKAKIMFAGVWYGGPRWDENANDIIRIFASDADMSAEYETATTYEGEGSFEPLSANVALAPPDNGQAEEGDVYVSEGEEAADYRRKPSLLSHELQKAKDWIGSNNPSVDEMVAWMTHRENQYLASQ